MRPEQLWVHLLFQNQNLALVLVLGRLRAAAVLLDSLRPEAGQLIVLVLSLASFLPSLRRLHTFIGFLAPGESLNLNKSRFGDVCETSLCPSAPLW